MGDEEGSRGNSGSSEQLQGGGGRGDRRHRDRWPGSAPGQVALLGRQRVAGAHWSACPGPGDVRSCDSGAGTRRSGRRHAPDDKVEADFAVNSFKFGSDRESGLRAGGNSEVSGKILV